MKELKEAIAKGAPEFIHVFDERTREFVPAWLRTYKRQEHVNLINSVVFNDVLTSYISKSIFIAPYENGHVMIGVVVAAVPTNIEFIVEFSHDNVDFHHHMTPPFGSLFYSGVSGSKEECIDVTLMAPWMRVRAVATGTTAVNKFTAEFDIVLNG